MIPMFLGVTWSGGLLMTPRPALIAASGRFRVPTAAPKGPNGEEAYWVGLGGYRPPRGNLCQAGISISRTNGRITAGLIAQDWPAPPVGKATVEPGDWITVSAGWLGHRWGAEAKDMRTGATLAVG